jgi:hypothetical protein
VYQRVDPMPKEKLSFFGINSHKGRMKKKERVMPFNTPVPSFILERYSNYHYEEVPSTFLSGTAGLGIQEGSAICIICGDRLRPETPFNLSLTGQYLTSCSVATLTANQRKYLVAHVEQKHPTMPFVFMEEWKIFQEEEFTDEKALIQEALAEAYKSAGGLDLGLFADLHEKRSGIILKLRLASIFGYAVCYTKKMLVFKLMSRKCIRNWSKRNEQAPYDCRHTAQKEVEKAIMATGVRWINTMEQCCLEFDFVDFLDCHGENWRCVWNSMVYFFQRGLYFVQTYPPMHAIKKHVENENFRIIQALDKALSEACDEYEKKKGGEERPKKKRKGRSR